jgi:hypothetical protein
VQSPTVRELYADRIAGALGVSAELVWRSVERAERPERNDRNDRSERNDRPARNDRPERNDRNDRNDRRVEPRAATRETAPELRSPRAQAPQPAQAARAPMPGPGPRPQTQAQPRPQPQPLPAPRLSGLALNLLGLCGDHTRLLGQLQDDVLRALDSPLLEELLREARDLALAGEPVTVDQLIELATPEARPQVAAAALSGKFINTESPDEVLRVLCRELRAQAIQREVLDLQKALVRKNSAGQESSNQQILLRIQELTLRRAHLLQEDREPGPNMPGVPDRTVEGDTTR